jgi:tetratricopeptide (TPR) repeat protein
LGAPEARICYERAEPLCRLLNRPLLLCVALKGQWRYSLLNDKLSATMQIAERVHSLAQEQNNPALMIEAYRALTVTHHYLGHFEAARPYARQGVQIWRSERALLSPVEEPIAPAVACIYYEAQIEWHFGEIDSCQATMVEAISLAKELNDMHALANALWHAAALAQYERNPAQVECYSSDLIELATRHNFAFWLPWGAIFRGWARSASGDTAKGLAWIEDGIGDWRATGGVLNMPYFLALKAEALYLAHRTFEALEAINEAEALVERFEDRHWCAELHRLRGIFLTALGADGAQCEAALSEAIRIAKEQKSVSLQKRAEATYAEFFRQKESPSGGRGVRLPLW